MKLFLIIILLSSRLFASDLSGDIDLLRTHVSTLVNSSKPRNFKNNDILDSIARYIKNQFKEYGYEKITEQKYEAREKTYKNVIASVGPENTDLIVIGAHYDVCGDFPGADDNASGIAGLLECARIVHKNREKLKHRVEFVAYSLEEPPFFNTRYMGSYLHASYLSDYNIKVKLMICLEMIGYYSDEKKSQEYPIGLLKPFYGSKGNYIACVTNFRSGKYALKLNKIFNTQTEIKSKYLIAPIFLPGIDFSDHRYYWRYKMHALMITDCAFYRNKNYHTLDDIIDRLNFDKMVQVVNGTVLFVLQL